MKLSSLHEARTRGNFFKWELEKEWGPAPNDKYQTNELSGSGDMAQLYQTVIDFAGDYSDFRAYKPEDITLGSEDDELPNDWIVIGVKGSSSCWNCDGEGYRGRSDDECDDCDGTGVTTLGYDNELGDGRYAIGTFAKA